MNRSIIFIGLVLLTGLLTEGVYSQTITYYQTGEEFVGPFPSWKNVKTDFGAKGDGTTNDAPAIQAALNALRPVSANSWSVLYFPAGTYLINSTLTTTRSNTNEDYNGITIIGEDPATTILSWNGAADQNMFKLDAWFSKVGRLTFDGKTKADAGLLRDGAFSTYCELSDLFFIDLKVGISLGGSSGQGQAEHAIERCRFKRCTNSGIATNNFNVMDIYTWFCLFEDCGTGMMNNAGSYNATECVFLRSKVADLASGSNLNFVVLNNTSVNSQTFFKFDAGLTYIQGNKIYNTINRTAIRLGYGYGGAPVCINNVIRSRGGYTGPSITPISTGTHHLVVNNTCTVANPVGTAGRVFTALQKIVDSTTLPIPATIQLPGTPQNKNRRILEVQQGTGNDALELQRKIISACSTSVYGINPVVHLSKGIYSLKSTVLIPRNIELQIVGDGGSCASILHWSGTTVGPAFRFLGPSRVTMRDLNLEFQNAGGCDAMTIESGDQVGGRIYCDQVLCGGGDRNNRCNTAILIDGVENSDFTFINGGWGEYTTVGVLVKGGPVLSTGGSTNGQVSLLLGALGVNENDLINVQNGGRVLAYGYRDETPMAGTAIRLTPSSSGAVTIGGMSWAGTTSALNPYINIDGFNGTFTYIGNAMGASDNAGTLFIKTAGNGSNCKVLNAANYINHESANSAASIWKDNSSPKATATMLNCFGGGVNQDIITIPNVVNQIENAAVDTSHVIRMLSQVLALRTEAPVRRPDGVTDVKLLRLQIRAGTDRMGLVIKRDPVSVIQRAQPIRGSAYRTIDKVVFTGSGQRISNMAKRVVVYDIMGRVALNKSIERNGDRSVSQKLIENLGSKGVYFLETSQ